MKFPGHQVMDPELFFKTQIGAEFADTFLTMDKADLAYFNPHPRMLEGTTKDEFQRNAMNGLAYWYNGNYDPESGVCTLYRGMDEQRASELEETGAIVSRTVDVFGGTEIRTARKNIVRLARGKTIDGDARDNLSRLIDKTYQRYRERDLDVNKNERAVAEIANIREALSGRPNTDFETRLLKVAHTLRHAERQDRQSYHQTVRAAGVDLVAPFAAVLSWDYPYIHLTTNADFPVMRHNQSTEVYPKTAIVRFEPGSIPAAPSIGRERGRFLHYTGKHTFLPCTEEFEWFGMGVISSSDRVSIEVVSTESLSEQAS